MATEEEETTPTQRALALQMRFSGATPTMLREYGIRDFRAGRQRLSSDPSYRLGYQLGRRSSYSLRRFIETFEPNTPAVRVGRECMSLLLHHQYKGNPPNPCPCYHWY